MEKDLAVMSPCLITDGRIAALLVLFAAIGLITSLRILFGLFWAIVGLWKRS